MVPHKGVQIPKELMNELSEDEKKGWRSSAYRSCLDDKHLVMLCKFMYDKYKLNGGTWETADVPASLMVPGPVIAEDTVPTAGEGGGALSDADIDDEDTEESGLSEETHLFAKFTSTYKIQDFLELERDTFPRNVVIEAALVFSDLSGFSKLCESYVEKYADLPAAAQGMSQAAEKLNVVVNSVFELQIKLVEQYNGDVVNFAGDAMFVLFRADSIKIAAQRAASCSLAMLAETQKRLKAMEEMGVDALDTQLFLHIGVGAGKIRCMTYGGDPFDKAEFVVAGPALTEAKDAGELAKSGEAIVSKTVYELCAECKPDAKLVPKERLAAEELESADFYVIHSLAKEPEMPPVTIRQQLLLQLSHCDNSSVEEAMRRFVPHSICACVDYGQSPKEAEECRKVTIMFIRLLDVQCEPFNYALPETVNIIQKCILEIYAVLGRYEGTVSRFQIDDKGTVLKIVFGFPMMAHEDDPVRAVHAAIEIRKNLKSRFNVQSCLGIATGTTICGLVGNEIRLEYTAVGSSVILAARLMQNANCCILVNSETFKGSSGSAVFEKICSIKVKGRDSKVPVWRPMESERRITKKLAPIRDTINIIGRDSEIDKLSKHLDEYMQAWHKKDKLRCCVISGPAGIGKATILGRFLGILQDRRDPSVKVLKASAEAIESKTPYYPWKKIFAKLLGVDAGKQATQFTHRACMNALRNILGDDFEEHPSLNDVMPTNIPHKLGADILDPRARNEKLTELLLQLLNKSIEKNPVAIIIHACQWLDNSSWAFLKQVMLRAKFPLLVVLTTRNENATDELDEVTNAGIVVDHIPITAFTPELSVQLVRKTLGEVELEDNVREVVWSRTHGIPLYCVEFARAVKDSGGAPLNELPDTINGAVLLRIDRLLPATKLVLKIVAVAGKDVSAQLIAEVAGLQFNPEELQSELEYLVSVDILFRDTRNGYCFRHEMVQEVVLGFLTFSQKRLLHKRIANFHLNSQDEVSPATLANHWEHAARGMDDSDLDIPAAKRAIWFLKAAAEEAMKAYAHTDAQKCMQRHAALVKIMPTSADVFDLEMALGLVDGNEKLLRQVLENFITNTSASLHTIQTQLEETKKNPNMDKNWRETIRFGAQSIASAASTLNATQLSDAALAVETLAVENQPLEDFDEVVDNLAKQFVAVEEVIKEEEKKGIRDLDDADDSNHGASGLETQMLDEMTRDALLRTA